jgi:PAS domain S-box-containing protein
MMECLLGICESIDEGIFVVDDRGVVVSWNRAAEELLGYSRKDVIGTEASVLGLERTALEKLQKRVLARKPASDLRVRLRTRGAAWKRFSLAAFPIDPGNGFCRGLACAIREVAQ